MHHPRDYLPALDRIEAALEASCGALVTLESINPGAADDDLSGPAGMQRHLGQAITNLRDAIQELRLAQSNGSSALAIGFVLNGNSREPDGVKSDAGQSNPRRTA